MKTVDWSIINNANVIESCEKAASKVARQYDGVMERDDLLQEAYIIAASNAERLYGYIDGNDLGLITRYMQHRLDDLADSEHRKFHKHVESFDA